MHVDTQQLHRQQFSSELNLVLQQHSYRSINTLNRKYGTTTATCKAYVYTYLVTLICVSRLTR